MSFQRRARSGLFSDAYTCNLGLVSAANIFAVSSGRFALRMRENHWFGQSGNRAIGVGAADGEDLLGPSIFWWGDLRPPEAPKEVI
jgi:hypothetical protein